MRSPSSRVIGLLLVIVLVFLFVTLTTRAKWLRSDIVLPSTGQRLNTTIELLTVKATGFDPPEMTVPYRSFFLVIENRSGVRELSFQFDKEVGARLNNIRVPYRRTSWSGLVDLPPGEYRMTEVTRPEWVFTLKITPL